MAQPGVDTTAIIKIAGAGFRLSLLLNAAGCQLAQSGIEIHSIAKGVSLFALALKQIGQTLCPADGYQSRVEALDKSWEIATHGQAIFTEIEQMLDRLKGTDLHDTLRTLPLSQRVKCCFRKQSVTYLLAQLESLKLSLAVLALILRLGRLMSGGSELTDETIAQERAEAQNMVIVRYWSMKRLDRLWELVEQEAEETETDQISRLIHHNNPYAVPVLPTRLPIALFAVSESTMSKMEKSPRDMLQYSDQVVDQLLAQYTDPPDWRKPPPKQARQRTTRPRSQYHAQVESDPEDTRQHSGLPVTGPVPPQAQPPNHPSKHVYQHPYPQQPTVGGEMSSRSVCFNLPPQHLSTAHHRSASSSRHARRDRKDRDGSENLARNAARGLVGIGAIAGFMDALEAFSII
ncbi:hypothetical protein ASPZODRAFT_15148 [Penicilliopsis zonata CBS 506.65]|uniref:Fungal N-terminal domain-containing protein n=1 Tax=Penicilliopsis zonata CBS 506.65 TaxID=1073090 RepID=A0A1L9SKS2_9EURO|nr:hypothetical protein ASPZODRAFT_15148 [Penicilliopsis zonata CBS 506.65]OJJ47701.1 hypothetical protein ASPZODRAFT_15148 [Penicilliopsis zonata CBS 506.65]